MRPVHWLTGAQLGVAILVLLSCAEAEPTGVAAGGRPETHLVSGLTGTLIACNPVPGDATTEVIGPSGGTIYVGSHKLRIPEGALAAPVTITAVAPSDTVNRVLLSPEGLTFQRPAWLTLSYANCGVLRWFAPKRIAYTTDALDILELLFSLDNPLARRVSAEIDHFSTYAVAW